MKSSLFLTFSSAMVLLASPLVAQKVPPGGYQNRSPGFTPANTTEEPAQPTQPAEPASRHVVESPNIGDADAMGTGRVEGNDVPEESVGNVSPKTKVLTQPKLSAKKTARKGTHHRTTSHNKTMAHSRSHSRSSGHAAGETMHHAKNSKHHKTGSSASLKEGASSAPLKSTTTSHMAASADVSTPSSPPSGPAKSSRKHHRGAKIVRKAAGPASAEPKPVESKSAEPKPAN